MACNITLADSLLPDAVIETYLCVPNDGIGTSCTLSNPVDVYKIVPNTPDIFEPNSLKPSFSLISPTDIVGIVPVFTDAMIFDISNWIYVCLFISWSESISNPIPFLPLPSFFAYKLDDTSFVNDII